MYTTMEHRTATYGSTPNP